MAAKENAPVVSSALPFPLFAARSPHAVTTRDAVAASEESPAIHSRSIRTEASSAMTRVLWQPFPGVPSRATSFPRVARSYSRILAQHSFGGLPPKVRLPDVSSLNLAGCFGIRSFSEKPGSVGALAGLTFKTNPSRTHRDAEPRLTNSEAL
jgi:hypothetical protein